VSVSQSWRGAPAVADGMPSPEVWASSETIARSGISAPTAWATASMVSGPVPDGSCGRRAAATGGDSRRIEADRPAP